MCSPENIVQIPLGDDNYENPEAQTYIPASCLQGTLDQENCQALGDQANIPSSSHQILDMDMEAEQHTQGGQIQDVEMMDDTEPNQKNTRKKHKTTFDVKWKESFPWLIHSERDGKEILRCDLCIKHNKNQNSAWVSKGFATIRLDKIKEHEKSQQHSASIAAEIAEKSESAECKINNNSKEFLALKAAMQCLNFLVQHNLPLTTLFQPFLEFCTETLKCLVLLPLQKCSL